MNLPFLICAICVICGLLTLPLHQSIGESGSLSQPAMVKHSAKDKPRAHQLPAGNFRCRHTAAGTEACCAQRLECTAAFRGTAPLPATRRFAEAATRAIARRAADPRCKRQRRTRCGCIYPSDL